MARRTCGVKRFRGIVRTSCSGRVGLFITVDEMASSGGQHGLQCVPHANGVNAQPRDLTGDLHFDFFRVVTPDAAEQIKPLAGTP